jgi:hypothetical protein
VAGLSERGTLSNATPLVEGHKTDVLRHLSHLPIEWIAKAPSIPPVDLVAFHKRPRFVVVPNSQNKWLSSMPIGYKGYIEYVA